MNEVKIASIQTLKYLLIILFAPAVCMSLNLKKALEDLRFIPGCGGRNGGKPSIGLVLVELIWSCLAFVPATSNFLPYSRLSFISDCSISDQVRVLFVNWWNKHFLFNSYCFCRLLNITVLNNMKGKIYWNIKDESKLSVNLTNETNVVCLPFWCSGRVVLV